MKNFISIILLLLGFFGCGSNSKKNNEVSESKNSVQQNKPIVPVFNSQKSYEYLLKQTDFGPRDPGSLRHEKCLNFLNSFMKQYADYVELQTFTHNGYDGKMLKMTNIFSSFNRQSNIRILLLAHWDSRPRSDQDPDPAKRNKPVLGANDGASGVAVLMEISRLLKSSRPNIGVDILFTDGEDYGLEGDTKNYLLGARYFAKNLPKNYKPVFGVLLDMVGDAELELKKERYSIGYAPNVVDRIWATGRDLGITQFSDEIQNWITDDHLPLNDAGIPTINIIDFAYPDDSNRYWHTSEDTPNKCSPESLEAVGKVLLHLIYNYN